MRLAGFLCAGLLGAVPSCLGALDRGDSDAQTPPTTGHADIEQWLAEGFYKRWTCEPTVHVARSPSPHGYNRICSNQVIADAMAADASGTAPWPKGAAAVKELYASETATEPVGHAVYVKTDASSADGANWYWYERASVKVVFPQDANGIVADSQGGGGPAKAICVSCHIWAGADAEHTPTPGSRDQVYSPVTLMNLMP